MIIFNAGETFFQVFSIHCWLNLSLPMSIGMEVPLQFQILLTLSCIEIQLP